MNAPNPFAPVTLVVDGVPRRALYTVPPRWVKWDDAHLVETIQPGWQLLTPVLLPDDCDVAPLGFLGRIAHPIAMFSAAGRLELNQNDPWITADTIVHELGHYVQRSVKGPLVYPLDYAAHVPGAWLEARRRGGTWHDWHDMERQVRKWAQQIVEAHFLVDGVYQQDRELVPIDAVAEIQKLLPKGRGTGPLTLAAA